MQRDGFGHNPHVPLKAVKLIVHFVKPVRHGILNRGGYAQKAFKGGFDDHALADTRTFSCSGKSIVELLGKPAPRVTSNSSGCGQSNSSTREAGHDDC